jgi:hypothetical protein
MAHPLFHAQSSVRKYGGSVGDYQAIHDWFDESKAFLADVRHRALRHHSEGIFLCEKLFGTSIVNSDGREIPVRFIGEQHVLEDLGRIPTAADWLQEMPIRPWMATGSKLPRNPTTEKPVAAKLRKASRPLASQSQKKSRFRRKTSRLG